MEAANFSCCSSHYLPVGLCLLRGPIEIFPFPINMFIDLAIVLVFIFQLFLGETIYKRLLGILTHHSVQISAMFPEPIHSAHH